MASLVQFCKDHQITAGECSAIGAVKKSSICFYELADQEYRCREYESNHEVVSFTGNIALVSGEPFIHAHVVLGDQDTRLVGGHLEEAVVAVTLEVSLVAYRESFLRAHDETVGLKLLQL